jgi:hypothetical protein
MLWVRRRKILGKFIDLTGRTFGRLTVLRRILPNSRGKVKWVCRCVCGKSVVVAGTALKSGNTTSCGCYNREQCRLRGMLHGQCGSKIYSTYHGIIARCYNKEAGSYPDYGGRGIKVCDRWREGFENFYSDMGDPPTPDHSIDRIDCNGDYEPGNCRWADWETQCNNKNNTRFLEFAGESKSITQWSHSLGMAKLTLYDRVTKLGWSAEKALTTPVRKRNKTT